MILIWLDYKLTFYYESLPRNETVNLDMCIEQLIKLNNAIKEKNTRIGKQ